MSVATRVKQSFGQKRPKIGIKDVDEENYNSRRTFLKREARLSLG